MKEKKVTPDFKQVSAEFSLNVEKDKRMRMDGHIRVDGKPIPMDEYTDAQLLGLYELLTKAVPMYYQACVSLCIQRGILKLDNNIPSSNGKNYN